MAIRCRCPPESRVPRSPSTRIVALRELGDEQVGVGRLRGGLDLRARGAGRAVGDVGVHRVVEQHGILAHDAHERAQRAAGEPGERHAVHQ